MYLVTMLSQHLVHNSETIVVHTYDVFGLKIVWFVQGVRPCCRSRDAQRNDCLYAD